MQHKLASGVIVIFGASGDLTKRKLMPAIFSLYQQGLITDKHIVLGASRTNYSDSDFQQKMKQALLEEYPNEEKAIDGLYPSCILSSI